MMQQASFTNWDFDSIWGIDEGNGYPYLLNVTERDIPVVTRITIPELAFNKTTVSFFTLSGRMIKKVTFKKAFKLDKMVSQVPLSRGTYIVRIDTEGMKRTVKRIVKR